MAAIVKTAPLTQEVFMALQEDGGGYEYEYGELIPLSPVDGQQSSAWGDVYVALVNHVRQHRLGKAWLDVLTYLEPDGSVRYFPDIVYLANDVLDRYDGKKIVGAPTLAVEVTTPHSDQAEKGRKQRAYHAAGVSWYWIVNTIHRVTEEYRWEEGGYILVSETPFADAFRPALFPGLEVVLEGSVREDRTG